jgi:ADP-ribose pyrophosphatase YjhB (NUDIX family)
MADDPIADRRRAHEEDYFQKKDRELIEKLRQKAAADQARRELGTEVGLSDPALLDELAELGFTRETVRLLPLVPVIEMAWAEGGVTAAERKLLTDVARARGVDAGSAADRQLTEWLDHRPAADVFRRATRLIRAMVDADAPAQVDVADVIAYAERIAEASGGILGIGRVSSEERETLGRIAQELKRRS